MGHRIGFGCVAGMVHSDASSVSLVFVITPIFVGTTHGASWSSQVTQVGVGCMVDSCRECASCKAGEENYCDSGAIMTYNGKHKYKHCLEYNEELLLGVILVLLFWKSNNLISKCNTK